jgi:hypothetical protein
MYVCKQIKNMIECKCINDKNKPSIIPSSKWLTLGNIYNVTHIGTTVGGFSIAVTLKEISLGKEYYPYEGFNINRFVFREEDIPKLIELMESCKELSKINIEQLTNQILVTHE